MVCIGPRLMALGVEDDPDTLQDPMEDMCAGEMQWMIGWCIDMMTAGEMPGSIIQTALAAPTADIGVFEPIDVPGATGTRAFGINPQGDIVGSYTDRTGTAFGVNPEGHIVGVFNDTAGAHGFLLR